MPDDTDEADTDEAPRAPDNREEDQPTERMDPRAPPVVTPDLSDAPTDAPIPGTLPENAGRDPGDVHRDEDGHGPLGKAGRRPVE